jgi:hypothetical protein
LKEEECIQLEENLLAEGCREALIVWARSPEELILVDGHNRYQICQSHRLPFNIQPKEFPDMEAVRVWMINHQMGRRNLTPEQQSYLRGKRYHLEKQQGKRTDLTSPQSEEKLLPMRWANQVPFHRYYPESPRPA